MLHFLVIHCWVIYTILKWFNGNSMEMFAAWQFTFFFIFTVHLYQLPHYNADCVFMYQ